MLKNYLKIALKVLARRKFFTGVSLFGIFFTLTVLLVVAAMADHLLAPIAPETNVNRTLHVQMIEKKASDRGHQWSSHSAASYPLLDKYIRDIPGVENMSIFSRINTVASFIDGEKTVSRLRRTDGAYWEILEFTFLEGGPFTQADADEGNFVAVINEATRRRFFDDAPALNKTIELDGQSFRVVGVVENVAMTRRSADSEIWVPHRTSRAKDYTIAFSPSYHGSGGYQALLLANSRADFKAIKAEFRSRLQHVELSPPYVALLGEPMTRLEQYAADTESPREGRLRTGRFLSMWLGLIGAFLLLPTANLVGINLSRFMERAPEIGVRKAFGASSSHLVWQFVFENIILCAVGGVLALVGAALVLGIIERSGLIPYADFVINLRVFLYALGLVCFFGLLSGVYPAWRTSRLHPVQALRGGIR